MLYIFNTTIAPTAGLTYHTAPLTPADARRLVSTAPVLTSAIGHEATAQIASRILDVHIEVNRIAAVMSPGDRAICVKLRGRPPEGVILSTEEVESIGYDLVLMTAADQSSAAERVHDWIDPESMNAHVDQVPPLEESVPRLLARMEEEISRRCEAELEGGIAYNGDDEYGSLRTGLISLCRRTVHEHLASSLKDYGADPTREQLQSVRSALVARLIDVLGEQGESVYLGA